MLLAVTRVQTLAATQPLTAASGFFFRCNGRLFVVTSRHVFFDGPSRHAPVGIELTLHADAADLTRVHTLYLPLYAAGTACWHQAQDGGGDIDVAALEITPSQLPRPHVLQAFTPDDLPDGRQDWDVGDAVAIPGFPLGFHDTVHHLPVVRTAAIASAYGVRFQGKGFFLTDGRTHRGSSGAPVLLHQAERDGTRRWRLLGVHASRMDMSGRDSAVDESLGLNCAWYANVLMTLTRTTAQASP
jgi:S1-C subfamily serine protease